MKYARVANELVVEIIMLPEGSPPIAELFHPSIVADCFEVGEDVQVGWVYAGGMFSPAADTPTVNPVPDSITRRQFILALKGAGLVSGEDALAWAKATAIPPAFGPVMESLPSDAALDAEITLLTMATAERNSPLIGAVIAAGLASANQVDAVFRAGAVL